MTRLFACLTILCLSTGLVAQTPEPRTVYRFDAEAGPAGPEWSARKTDTSPKGRRSFLGPFSGRDRVTLHLADLPEHKLVRVQFDLILVHAVDGSSRIWGPDVWQMGVIGGPRLAHTTFSNCGFFSDNNAQAFPDDWPHATHPAWTGAATKQTLGYVESWGGDDRTFGVDSSYKMEMVFLHDGPELELYFRSFWLEGPEGEAWGLDDVRVQIYRQLKEVDAADMAVLHEQMIGRDPVAANEAVWALAATGDAGAAFLSERVDALPDSWKRQVQTWIQRLDDSDWRVREQATQRLASMTSRVEPLLRRAMEQTDSLEVRARLQSLLQALADAPANEPGHTAAASRLVRCLEAIGTAKARQVLDEVGRSNAPLSVRWAARQARMRSLQAGIDRQLHQVDKLARQGKYRQAEALVGQALRLCNADTPLHAKRIAAKAGVLSLLAETARQATELEQLLARKPKDTEARAELAGLLLGILNRPAQAAALETSELPQPVCRRLAAASGEDTQPADRIELGLWLADQAELYTPLELELLARAETALDQAVTDLADNPLLRAQALDAYAKVARARLSARLRAGEWIDLLALIDVDKDAGSQPIARTAEGIRMHARNSELHLPVAVDGGFELDLLVESSMHETALCLPAGTNTVMLRFGSEAPDNVRRDGLAGMSKYGPEVLVRNGLWSPMVRNDHKLHQLRTRFIPTGDGSAIVSLDLDHALHVRHDGLLPDLRPAGDWVGKRPNPFINIGASTMVLHAVRIRLLSGKAEMKHWSKPQPAKEPAK
jgi:hypothetical protein